MTEESARLHAAEAALQDVDALVELHAWGEEDPLDARDRLYQILTDFKRATA